MAHGPRLAARHDALRGAELGRSWAPGGYETPTVRAKQVADLRKRVRCPTAEYAVGTAAGAGFAGLLYQLLSGGFGDQLLKTLFDHVMGLLGIG